MSYVKLDNDGKIIGSGTIYNGSVLYSSDGSYTFSVSGGGGAATTKTFLVKVSEEQ